MAPPPPRKRSIAGSPTTTGSPALVTSNYRFVEKGRWAAKKGTLPLPGPTTVPEILTDVILYGCRKVLFLKPKIRLIMYAVSLFLFSLLADYLPFPKSYFSEKDNFLNVYFVKFSWAWTFVFTGMFMYLTCATYCCGNRDRILRHMSRLGIGTLVWFTWTSVFRLIEESTALCLLKDGTSLYATRRGCVSKTGKWTSFDISGHSFLLIWCVFFISEEAKAIVGWDGIKDLIRNEDYYRSKMTQQGPSGDAPPETNLNALSDEEFTELKVKFSAFDVPAKMVLICMTILTLIWDLMILMTSIYFHVMIEKILGGLAAAFTWFVIYQGLFKSFSYIGLPGCGLFKYSHHQDPNKSASKSSPQASSSLSTRNKSKPSGTTRQRVKEPDDNVPKFMGMPLYPVKNINPDSADRLDNVS